MTVDDPLAVLWVWCCRSRCPVIATVHVCDGVHRRIMFGPVLEDNDG